MDETDLRGEHANLIKTLLRKRRDVAFHITELESEVETTRADLAHLDAVIRMFAPDIPPNLLPKRLHRPRQLHCFAHGEITRRVYDMLRGGNTIQAIDVARRAMEEKELPLGDKKLTTEVSRRVAMQLNHMRRDGKVERIGRGRGARWRLVADA